MTAPPPKPEPPATLPSPPAGFSQFLAKVLDQLSLSAWLPAVMAVVNLAVLTVFYRHHSMNLVDAIKRLTSGGIGELVLLLLVLVLATMITQAFSFEAIRALEGYWRRGMLAGLRDRRIRSHASHRAALERRWLLERDRSFARARQRMLRGGTQRGLVDALEALVTGGDPGEELREEAAQMGWRQFGDPAELARMDAIDARLRAYPEEHRVMPTRLGNVLRAAEDSIDDRQGEMEGYVLRNYPRIPDRLRLHHDQFRTRLDMYCTLVFVCTVLAAASQVLWFGVDGYGLWIVVLGAVYATLAVISYGAAVSSAIGYGTTLRTIKEVTRNEY